MILTRKERLVTGKALLGKCLPGAHRDWKPRAKRRDPIQLLIEGRMEKL